MKTGKCIICGDEIEKGKYRERIICHKQKCQNKRHRQRVANWKEREFNNIKPEQLFERKCLTCRQKFMGGRWENFCSDAHREVGTSRYGYLPGDFTVCISKQMSG